MLVGPVFTREAVIAPRRLRFYLARTVYLAAFWLLLNTAWLVLTGTQIVRNVGDMARFGSITFHTLAPLQLVVVLFFSALGAAASVAQEKDRRTLVLLLLTRLSNHEIVLGKVAAGLLHVATLVLCALPLFLFLALFGGVSLQQIALAYAVTLLAAVLAATLGAVIAFWREKTFQTLALTTLGMVLWIGLWEAVVLAAPQHALARAEFWAAVFSPWRAMTEAIHPPLGLGADTGRLVSALSGFVLFSLAATAVLNALAIWKVRQWNSTPDRGTQREEEQTSESIFAAPWEVTSLEELEKQLAASPEQAQQTQAPTLASALSDHQGAQPAEATRWWYPPDWRRNVWANPVLWREICTWAYGRKVLLVRGVWVLLVLAVAGLFAYLGSGRQGLSPGALATGLIPLGLLSLLLVNALAVTSITNERDGKTLDLLLVSDLTPKEIIFGKLGGVLYNAKEVILLPLLLLLGLWWFGAISRENLFFLVAGQAILVLFAAVLGMHVGMSYAVTRQAIATSLGTLFFLAVGVATCMRIMVAFGGNFQVQLAPFLIFMLGGGVAMFFALGMRNPSPAITLASLLCPFATFYAMTSFLLQYTLGVFLVVVVTYGFTTLAMLVPAVAEFDVATGRTTALEE